MEQQKEINEENQRLRMEVERLRSEAARTADVREEYEYFVNMIASEVVIGLWACMEFYGAILLDYLTQAAILKDHRGMMVVGAAKLQAIVEGSEVIFQDFQDVTAALRVILLLGDAGFLLEVVVRAWWESKGNSSLKEMAFSEVIFQDFRDMFVSKGVWVEINQVILERVPENDGLDLDKLQAAMAMQLGMNSARPEQIRPGTTASELPKLSEGEMAAINVGDWLHGLSGPMGDLTDGSAQWWSQVLASLEAFYKDYIHASAVKKLQLKADDYAQDMLKEAKWLRVDKRAATMLLQAIPDSIKTEVLANRLQTTLSILARILTIYRPGSAVERQQVLKALESPTTASSPMELVEVLRRWARWLKRAQDLALQVPDPSILLRGLDAASRTQLEKHGEVAFRANMLRYSLELDSAPSLISVVKLQSHLLAEFEQIAYRGRTRTTSTTTPSMKAMGAAAQEGQGGASPKGTGSPSTTATSRPCKFFLMDNGCQRANCKFSHDWANVPKEERAERCKACGGKGHMRKNCPVKVGGGEGQRRDDPNRGAPQPKVKNVKGGDNKRDDGTAPLATSTATSSSAPTGTAGSTSSASASMDSTVSAPSGSESASSVREVDDFLKNATQMLKMMAEQHNPGRGGPSMKMLKKAIRHYESKMALVDSGATHPLRLGSSSEWAGADEVDVVVAGDGVQRMRQTTAGTLLLEPNTSKAQTILPVGSLVSVLGYELAWTRKRCVLKAPDGREFGLRVNSGCPEMSEATALELIAEIEQEKIAQLSNRTEETKKAVARARAVQLDPCWERSMKEYVKNGKFEDGFSALAAAPWATGELHEDLAKIVTDLPKDETEAWALMQQLGFNRRMRKRLMSKDWIVKLCSGKRSAVDKVFKGVESNGTVVLDVDVQRLSPLDLFKAGQGVMRMLLWGAATGRVAGILCGLPKHNALEHSLRAVVLNEVAMAGRTAMCGEMDIPFDGVAFSLWASAEAEQDESSLVWVFKWFRRWIAENGLDLCHFEQGGLGHSMRRPTTMTTNLDVAELKGIQDSRPEPESEKGSWSMWAPMMARVLVRGLKRWKQRPGWYSRLVKALKAVDRRAWERHLANDHVPYRADCLQCIHTATGRPHRKCLHRDCYVLSADTLGPVRIAGTKGERYAVVFTYQFPKQKLIPEDQPVREEELDGWSLDAETDKSEAGAADYGELEEYSPDDGPDVELSPAELEELQRVQRERPGDLPAAKLDAAVKVLGAKALDKKDVSDDWWEFRESTGVLIRHHRTPRTRLFRPTSWNGCPVSPSKLDYTRVTEVKYVGGGVETETSDWHGPQSGSRSLERPWTGRTTFHISTAEIPEEESELQKDEETWEQLIGDLTKPVEMDTIYLVYPVRARRGGDIMLAVQEAVLRLKLLGLPVARLHSDRGSEFASKGLRKWLLDHDIYHTRSEALVPQTNGAAERGVRWFKTMAKVLLAEAKVGLKYWTLAMQHAANRRLHERLGLNKPRLLAFGSKVMIRRKVFGNNKKYDLTDRWEQGTYLGLSDTIKGGAVVLRPTGVLTETLNLKDGVVDPHVLLAEATEDDDGGGVGDVPTGEVPVVELPEPDHRLSGKQPPPALRALKTTMEGGGGDQRVPSGWTMRSLVNQQEDRARYYYNMGKFDDETCAEVLRDVHVGSKAKRSTRGTHSSALILGGYVHGGMRGTTTATRRRPWLTKYLNMVLRQRTMESTNREPCWATLGVFKATEIPPHRDLRNKPGMPNFVTEVGGEEFRGLWLSDAHELSKEDGTEGKDLQRELPDGAVAEGRVVDIKGKVAVFDPKKLHSYVEGEDGNRWILAGFTPLNVESIPPEPVAFMNKCGFPLEGTGAEVHDVDDVEWGSSDSELSDDASTGEEEDLENKTRVLRCELQEEEFQEANINDATPYLLMLHNAFEDCARELERLQLKAIKRVLKVSPGTSKEEEVEELLKTLEGPLEVVHTVSLPEVKKYVQLWKEAIVKEVNALMSSGTVKRLSPEQTRELKKAGLTVLPGKAVFTAKPPSEASSKERFRRKCRIVVCGNFLPAQGQNVYASGTSADTLRIAVALAVQRGWSIGSTDVANAFTLAPMPSELTYALTPPTIVIMAGAAEPGETWQITRVLYGLREAPRLWGDFRNLRFQEAKIVYGDKVLVLTATTTDENLWRVTYQGEDTILGLVLVYVDDILMLSEKEIVKTIYQWLVSDWKCSNLEWAEEDSLRFLGIELRVFGGGVHLSQTGYVRDLLRQHGMPEEVGATLTVPCAREWLQDADSDEEPETAEEATVRMAQKATGEALWLSTRSRPELAHAVGCMASLALRRPLRALEISKRVMKYLSKTVEYGIWYKVVPDDPALVVYSDASYAPGGGRVAALLSELKLDPVMHLRIDNAAAQGLASESPGLDGPVAVGAMLRSGGSWSGIEGFEGVEGRKEDLALDGSVEFYFVLVVSLIAAEEEADLRDVEVTLLQTQLTQQRGPVAEPQAAAEESQADDTEHVITKDHNGKAGFLPYW
ncbi:RE1 [Symbiodinium sp. CCMP2592]|nr:RE1 [Symbiodinium sp. CCMP2592]